MKTCPEGVGCSTTLSPAACACAEGHVNAGARRCCFEGVGCSTTLSPAACACAEGHVNAGARRCCFEGVVMTSEVYRLRFVV